LNSEVGMRKVEEKESGNIEVENRNGEGGNLEDEKLRRCEVKGADLRSLRSVSLDERFAC
jgi:hypothetical protein